MKEEVKAKKGVKIIEVHGDLLEQDVEVIVNPWNRNIIPWFLLLPQGVSGAIKKHGGVSIFNELLRMGPLKLGTAVVTGSGHLKFKKIIHVVGINMLWRASEFSIRESVRNTIILANELKIKTLAFPIIGAGSGSFKLDEAKRIMLDELSKTSFMGDEIKIVVYKK